MWEDRHLLNGGEATRGDLRRSRAAAPPKHATAASRDARYLPNSGEATAVDLGRGIAAAPAKCHNRHWCHGVTRKQDYALF